MCKPFPPPLVRGGVFEVGLETKYRDIADGNSHVAQRTPRSWHQLETKYRDIADGNCSFFRNLSICTRALETKYRDIADGNRLGWDIKWVPLKVGNQVPRYSGLKRCEKSRGRATSVASEPKYRDIADGEHPCFLLLAASCFI